MSATATPPVSDPIEQSVQDCLKHWPAPWRRYNGRIIAFNGATVGHFAPKIPVSNVETIAGVSVGISTVEAISATIGQLVGLGEIMERAFRQERFLHREQRKSKKLADALYRAEQTLNLLANYGLPDEDRAVCFAAMKDIAADAERQARATLDTAEGGC